MTKYDFDQLIERRNTNCLKYDFAAERHRPADILPFWVADMDFAVPPEVREELVRRSQHGIFGYTDVKEDYFQVLQKWFVKHHGWKPKDNSLVVTPGVVFAICAAIRALTKEGDAVLIQRPVYYPFSLSIEQNNRRLINNPLILNEEGRYEIDFIDFEQKIINNQVKLFILCSPHNPVGRVWTKEELTRLGDICVKHQVFVVADEIHEEFTRPGHPHFVFASLKPEFTEIAITCTAPSKTFNLAGLQVSNIFSENASLKRKFVLAMEQVGYSQPNALGMFACQAAYAYGEEWLLALKEYLEDNLQKTKEFLKKNLPAINLIEPEGTYLVWLDFRQLHLKDEEIERKMVEEAGLWLDGGLMFGPEGAGFQRLNIACPWTTLAEGLKRLEKAFK